MEPDSEDYSYFEEAAREHLIEVLKAKGWRHHELPPRAPKTTDE